MSGRVFAGARALYRAAGVSGDDMGKKPIIAIANSFDEFLPGHVHLNKVGRIVSEAIKEASRICFKQSISLTAHTIFSKIYKQFS